MKLFLDQGVLRRSAELLVQEGLDVAHASEAGLSSATDGATLTVRSGRVRVRTLPVAQRRESQ